MNKPNVGIVGIGIYLPEKKMTAKEVSEATNGTWSEEAVINKLGIVEKYVASDQPCDGTQEMELWQRWIVLKTQASIR